MELVLAWFACGALGAWIGQNGLGGKVEWVWAIYVTICGPMGLLGAILFRITDG